MAPSTVLTVRLSEELKDRLDRLAVSTARSKSWLAAEAISTYVKLQEWQVEEIEARVREADADEFASDNDVAAVIARWTGHEPPR